MRRQSSMSLRSALGVTLVSLGLFALLIATMAWLLLGVPELPRPTRLTTSQVAAIGQVGAGSAAAVGVTVGLVVAYRKQRQTEDAQLSISFQDAVKCIGDDSHFTRVAGVLALRDMADAHEQWRQMCIEILCAAMLRYNANERNDAALCLLIADIIRSRFVLDGNGWVGCNLRFASGSLGDVDLHGVVMAGGSLELADISVMGHANFEGVQIIGARLSMSDLHLHGKLNLHGVRCVNGGTVDVSDTFVHVGGELSIEEASVLDESSVQFVRTAVSERGALKVSSAFVEGSLSCESILVGQDGKAEFNSITCAGGSVFVDDLHLAEGGLFDISQSVVEGGAFVGIDSIWSEGVLGVAGVAVRDGSTLVMRDVWLSGGHLALGGSSTNDRSSMVIDLHLGGDSMAFLRGVENNGRGSVLAARFDMHDRSRVEVGGGGNYEGHLDAAFERVGHRPSSAAVAFSGFNVWGGEVRLLIDPGIEIIKGPGASMFDVDRTFGVSKIDVHLPPDVAFRLGCQGNSDSFFSHHWSDHLRNAEKLTERDRRSSRFSHDERERLMRGDWPVG